MWSENKFISTDDQTQWIYHPELQTYSMYQIIDFHGTHNPAVKLVILK